MLWAQSLVSFALWVGYGIFIWRRLRARPGGLPINRVWGGPLLLLLGVGLLAAGFAAAEALGGVWEDRLTLPAWAAVTLFGAGFVHCQTVGAAWMAGAAQPSVTSRHSPTSSKQGKEDLS